MLRHMCPPLGLGKRCPARVAYKVRKDLTFTQVSYGCWLGLGGGGVVQEGGARDLSAQRGVPFSVVVPLVLLSFSVFLLLKVGVG